MALEDRQDIRFRYSEAEGKYQVLANWFQETDTQGYRFKGVASGTTTGEVGIGTDTYTPAYTIESFEFIETDYKLKTETAEDFEEYTEADGDDKKLTGVTITKFGRILANEFIEGEYTE